MDKQDLDKSELKMIKRHEERVMRRRGLVKERMKRGRVRKGLISAMSSDMLMVFEYLRCFQGIRPMSVMGALETKARGNSAEPWMNVQEVSKATGLVQTDVSLGLADCYAMGLVDRFREGRFVYYSLNEEVLEEVRGLAGDFNSISNE